MADGAGDLGAQEVVVVAEVALEGVLVDDDPVGVVVARDGVAVVVAVGAVLAALAGDDDGNVLQDVLELVGQLVERLGSVSRSSAPDSSGGLSRNSSMPTVKAAAAAALSGWRSESLTGSSVVGDASRSD